MFTTVQQAKDYCSSLGITMVDFKMIDIDGRWRHLTLPAERLNESMMEYGVGFDGSNYGYAPVENSDMVFIPDLKTAVQDPFNPGVLTMNGDVMLIKKPRNLPFDQYPRNVVKRAADYLKETGIADTLILGPEFEFHIFDGIRYAAAPQHQSLDILSEEAYWATESVGGGRQFPLKDGYHGDCPSDSHFALRNEMCENLKKFGVAVKYHHHEVGSPAQEEIETELGELTAMADATMVVKYVVRNTAARHGKYACFMPKPVWKEAGNGMHVHMLLFKDGKPLFYDEKGYSGLSQTAQLFIGGLLYHAPSLCGLTNPGTNSYKRLVPGFEAPVTVGYATANRSAIIRIPAYAKSPETKRFELRNPDALCNPYFAYAAILMAGLDGIERGIHPEDHNWGPFDFNLFDLSPAEKEKIQGLPENLKEALDALEKDNEYLLKGGVFPKKLIETWIERKRQEYKRLDTIPGPAEFEAYGSL